jgi:hypothetical protein
MQQELLTAVFVLFCDLTILVPTILEADSVVVTDDKMTIKCLFFKKTLAWSDIIEFKSSGFVRVSTVRTRRGFFFLNKRTLPQYPQLEESIRKHLGTELKTV